MVMIPPHTSMREATLPARFERFLNARARTRVKPCRRAVRPRARGFMAAGLSYCYLVQALRELGLEGRFPILEMGGFLSLDERFLTFLSPNGWTM
jgi:hypothetical protein